MATAGLIREAGTADRRVPAASLRVLFLVSAHNSLSQRAWIALTELGHEVTVAVVDSAAAMEAAVGESRPELIVDLRLEEGGERRVEGGELGQEVVERGRAEDAGEVARQPLQQGPLGERVPEDQVDRRAG